MTKIDKKRVLTFVLFVIVITSVSYTNNTARACDDNDYWLTLDLIVNAAVVGQEFASRIADYLKDIGINITISVLEWYDWWERYTNVDYELALGAWVQTGESPDYGILYNEGSDVNFYGLTRDIPYCEEAEQLSEEVHQEVDIEKRQQFSYEYQQLMMDKIIPHYPLYALSDYKTVWSNTEGYDGLWKISDCLPYMSYDGYHTGQTSLDEFNFACDWAFLDPLYIQYVNVVNGAFGEDNSLVNDLIHEQMVEWSPEQLPTNTGIIHDWEKITETHYKFYLRDNLYWNPSYNVTNRNSSSTPLSAIPTGELMVGLKNGEYSDGTNQQVTAKDAVFTLLALGSPNVNAFPSWNPVYHMMDFMTNCYVDPVDPLAFHVLMDSNPETPEAEPFGDLWWRLSERIVPEFFLNSSDLTEYYTGGGIKTVGLFPGIFNTLQWLAFDTSAFGCGKYMVDYLNDSITVFQKSPYWFGVGAIDGQSGLEPTISTVKVHYIAQPSIELVEFKAGRLDWVNLKNYQIDDRKSMEDDPFYSIHKVLYPSFSFLAFNSHRPYIGSYSNYVFNDEEGKEDYTRACSLKKAICYAIDKEALNNEFYGGEMAYADSVFYPYTSYYYYDDIIKYDYDLDTALDWLLVDWPPTEDSAFPTYLSLMSIFILSAIVLKKGKKRKS